MLRQSFWIYSVKRNVLLKLISSVSFYFFFFFFWLFRATPGAYESSQGRGPIGAAAASLQHSQDPSCICNLHHSSRQHWILNLLSEARDQTCNVMVPSWVCFCCTTTGTPHFLSVATRKFKTVCACILFLLVSAGLCPLREVRVRGYGFSLELVSNLRNWIGPEILKMSYKIWGDK